jgi:hypothetical protein
MNYYIQQRYQDSGWQTVNMDVFTSLRKAVEKCVEFASQSIIYGMVRLVDSDNNVLKTWGAGDTYGQDLTAAANAAMQEISKPDEFYYLVSVETEPGSNQFEPAISVTPTGENTNLRSLNTANVIASEVSQRCPGQKVRIGDSRGNAIRTILFTGESEPEPEPKPEIQAQVDATDWKSGSFAEAEDEDEEVQEYPDLLPEKLRVVGVRHQGQFFITVGCLDALIVEMQLTNARHLQGSEDVDLALESVRDWLVAAENRLKGKLGE